MNKCKLVRETCKYVSENAKHVKINQQKVPALAKLFKFIEYNSFQHHSSLQHQESTLFQFFMLDAMNFCFWPLEKFQYQHLATHVANSVKNGITLHQLQKITEQELNQNIFQGIQIPLASERARILNEMASVVLNHFDGSFTKIVSSANKSAVKLLQILTSHFPNMQDHSIYNGHQIHFYKRAQILIGDIWGKFNGKNIGQFTDIDELTMFADYRVPQVLHHYGVFEYSKELEEIVLKKQEIVNRNYEVEIRACSVEAVEIIKRYLNEELKIKAISIQVDWFLWGEGEENLQKIPPHHRVLTIYY